MLTLQYLLQICSNLYNVMETQNQKFNITKKYLGSKIFVPQPPLIGGVWSNLNITVLPDYFAYIKQQLTPQQRILLSDYRLQTYLLETALKAHPKNDFDICTNQILEHIRNHSEFWARNIGSEQELIHQAIQEYKIDCQNLAQTPLIQKYPLKQFVMPKWTKMQDDFIYISSECTKGCQKFTSTLYNHICPYFKKTQNIQLPHKFQQFVLEFIVNLAIKSKHKYRQFLTISSEESISQLIETQIRKFTQYLGGQKIDARSLTVIRDYNIIANSLFIVKCYLIKIGQIKMPENMRIKAIVQNFDGEGTLQVQWIFDDLVNRFIWKYQLCIVLKYLERQGFHQFSRIFQIRNDKESKSCDPWLGMYNITEAEIEQKFKSYTDIINHPQNISKQKYKVEGAEVSWQEDLYRNFLKKYLEYFYLPTNNKRIALSMGKEIQANHVKHVKGIYTRNMTARIANGEIGGGKKGIFDSKTQFINRDIQNFNMKWFRKQGKNKTRKIKKRRRREAFMNEQHDSDY